MARTKAPRNRPKREWWPGWSPHRKSDRFARQLAATAGATRPDIGRNGTFVSSLHILSDCACRSEGKSTTGRVHQVQTASPWQFESSSHKSIPQRASSLESGAVGLKMRTTAFVSESTSALRLIRLL